MCLHLYIYLLLLPSLKSKLYLNIQSENTNLNTKISNNSYHVTEQKSLISKLIIFFPFLLKGTNIHPGSLNKVFFCNII